MIGTTDTILVNLPGTLGANASGVVHFPLYGATLINVAVCGSNANGATLALGPTADPDGYLVAGAIGDLNVPANFGPHTFDGALADPLKISAPHLNKGATLVWTLDYDGDGGVAAANVTIQFTVLNG